MNAFIGQTRGERSKRCDTYSEVWSWLAWRGLRRYGLRSARGLRPELVIRIEPCVTHGRPGELHARTPTVACQTNGEVIVAQEAHGLCCQRLVIVAGNDEGGFVVGHNVRDA